MIFIFIFQFLVLKSYCFYEALENRFLGGLLIVNSVVNCLLVSLAATKLIFNRFKCLFVPKGCGLPTVFLAGDLQASGPGHRERERARLYLHRPPHVKRTHRRTNNQKGLILKYQLLSSGGSFTQHRIYGFD